MNSVEKKKALKMLTMYSLLTVFPAEAHWVPFVNCGQKATKLA